MQTYITKTGIANLKQLLNKKIISVTADSWCDFKRSYGNILIELESGFVQIENNYRIIPFFGDTEELAGFDIKKLQNKSEFDVSVMPKDLMTKIINKNIKGIKIIQDVIKIVYVDNSLDKKFTMDQAIIFDLSDEQWLVSQQSIFTPMATMVFSNNIDEYVRSVDEIKEEWADDPEDGQIEYEVFIERSIIQI